MSESHLRRGSKSPRSPKKFKARLINSKTVMTQTLNDVLVVNIPSFYVKTDVIQKPRILNVGSIAGKDLSIPVGGLSSNYFVYRIEVRNAYGVAWVVERSYNEFRSLHSRIKSRFPVISQLIPKFPKKTLITMNPNSEKAEFRRKFFMAYLQALLQLKPRINYVNDFLDLHRHQNSKEKKELNIEDFELLKMLGKGSFGKVFLVRVIGGDDIYAMKVLKKSEVKERRQIEHTKTELRVMGATNHPFIVTLRFAFHSDTRLFMVSDFCQGGELFYHLKSYGVFKPNVVQFYSCEISLALQYLHDNQIIFRDLKPENILLDQSGHIQLTDFGLSRDNMTDPQEGAKTLCGTPEYLAPEILTGKQSNKGYGFAVDWWALGILIYEMFCGLPAFYDTDKKVMIKKILRGKLDIARKDIPESGKDLISQLLVRDPNHRLGVKNNGFVDFKNHEFYTEFEGGIDFDKVLQRQVEPPYKPTMINITDHFEKEFTDQVARLSEDETQPNQPKDRNHSEMFDDDDEFAGFNFTRQPNMDDFFDADK